jgi:hypothetical protein
VLELALHTFVARSRFQRRRGPEMRPSRRLDSRETGPPTRILRIVLYQRPLHLGRLFAVLVLHDRCTGPDFAVSGHTSPGQARSPDRLVTNRDVMG